MKDSFYKCHPIINIYYFIVVLGCTMCVQHPVLLLISFVGATVYALYLKGARKVLRSNFLITLPVLAIIALLNPLFNHYGVTPIYYIEKSGNWITLEAMVYGVVLGAIVFITIEWFSSFNEIMTTDKLVYLFGRILPAFSLILSMTLRFVPRFIRQLGKIRDAQKALGMDVSNGGPIKRAKHGLSILSILVSWALENSIDTADSMNNRGYGLKGRTSFSLYRFDRRDSSLLVIMTGLLIFVLYGLFNGAAFCKYNPRIILAGYCINGYQADISCSRIMVYLTYIAFGIFCFIPVILNLAEDLSLKHALSKINS